MRVREREDLKVSGRKGPGTVVGGASVAGWVR